MTDILGEDGEYGCGSRIEPFEQAYRCKVWVRIRELRDEFVDSLAGSEWDFAEKVIALESEVLRLRAENERLKSEWAIMARACGNWRTWSGEAVDDHEHPDWKVAAAALSERDSLRAEVEQLKKALSPEGLVATTPWPPVGYVTNTEKSP
jgi:hypothetical protein